MFNGLKRRMYNRIEKNCIKVPNVDGSGKTIYLKQGKLLKEWRTIYPPVNLESVEKNTDANGNIDWNNVKWDKINLIFGSKANAIMTAIVGVITILLIIGVRDILLNPCVQACMKGIGNIMLIP